MLHLHQSQHMQRLAHTALAVIQLPQRRIRLLETRRMRVALIMGQVIYTKLSIRPRTSSADLVEKHLKELPITFTTSALTHNNPD